MLSRREGSKVPPIELFFDLVFVYAITQVVQLMADNESAQGLVRGLLVLGLLWWCWSSFAWLGNTVYLDEGVPRFALFAVMATMFVISLAIPEAFDDLPGGLSGPLLFASCYLIVRLIHLGVYWFASSGDAGLRRQVSRSLVVMFVATTPLFIAPFTDGWFQTGLWALVLLIDWSATLALGTSGWRVNSASHWAERHGLVVILALGESVVSLGVGVIDQPISWAIVVASASGIGVAVALWWTYFDMVALGAERVLSRARGDHRSSLAVHGYTYLHFPLIAGIIMLAFGLKKVLSYVGDSEHHSLTDPLHGVGLFALFGGVVLYLVGHVAFGRRALGVLKVYRLAAAGLLVVLGGAAWFVPALAALVMLTAVGLALITVETFRHAEARAELRASHHETDVQPD